MHASPSNFRFAGLRRQLMPFRHVFCERVRKRRGTVGWREHDVVGKLALFPDQSREMARCAWRFHDRRTPCRHFHRTTNPRLPRYERTPPPKQSIRRRPCRPSTWHLGETRGQSALNGLGSATPEFRLRQRIETCRDSGSRPVLYVGDYAPSPSESPDCPATPPPHHPIATAVTQIAVAIDDGRAHSHFAGERAASFAVNAWRRLQPLAQLFLQTGDRDRWRRRTRRRSPVRIYSGPRLCFCGRAGSRTGSHHHEHHQPETQTGEGRNARMTCPHCVGGACSSSPVRNDLMVCHQPRLIGGQLRMPRRHPVRPPLSATELKDLCRRCRTTSRRRGDSVPFHRRHVRRGSRAVETCERSCRPHQSRSGSP